MQLSACKSEERDTKEETAKPKLTSSKFDNQPKRHGGPYSRMIHRLFLPCRFKLNGRSVGGIPNKSHHADQNPESVEKIVSSALVCEFSSFFPDTPTLNEGQQEYNYDAKGSVVRLKLKLALAKR